MNQFVLLKTRLHQRDFCAGGSQRQGRYVLSYVLAPLFASLKGNNGQAVILLIPRIAYQKQIRGQREARLPETTVEELDGVRPFEAHHLYPIVVNTCKSV
jgi:hypothetical protein